ncbi:MAG: putative bifunctional diguanylate cyclase/phosphodiesterase [Pseudonocardiaceae bacterium]
MTDRPELARTWSTGLRPTSYVPLSRQEIDDILRGLLDCLIDTLGRAEFSPRPATDVGTRLVATGFTGEESLGVTVEVLGPALPELPELRAVDGLAGRISALLGALVSGYNTAYRRWTFDQQEQANRALLQAKQEAERDLRASEARFREVFEAAPLGIAISRLDGAITDTNATLAEILGHPPSDLAGRAIGAFFHPEDAGRMALAYQELAMGRRARFRTRAQLRDSLAESTWGSVAVSVLRDGCGEPTHHVTMVADFSDVHLLEQQLHHQTLHDLLTGLPNQEYFWIHLRAVLEGAEPGTTITLCKIDLDGFAAVNDGHGHEAGNLVLRTVATRLEALVARERAMTARFGADEFVIVIEDALTTPDVAGLATGINAALAEPVDIGDHGLTVTAGVGVVRRPTCDMAAADLVRAADATLRRAKRTGRGQWGLHDPHADAAERTHYALATAMPAAWQNGQIELRYQPLVRLDPAAPDTGRIVAVAALLCWEHPQRGPVAHDECVRLAKQTGLALSLGPWLLQQGCRQLRHWRDRLGAVAPPLRIDLPTDLAQDPDLVAVLRATLKAAGLEPADLQLGIPVDLVVADGAAEDNLRVLAESGVWTVLTRYGQAVGNLATLESVPAQAVDIAEQLVRTTQRPESVLRRALTTLVPLIRDTGAAVVAGGIDCARQAGWWRDIGADSARGALFGAPCGPDEMARLLMP